MGNCQQKLKYNADNNLNSKHEEDTASPFIHEGAILNLSKFIDSNRKLKIITCSEDKKLAIIDRYLPRSDPLSVIYGIGHTKAVNRVVGTSNNIWSVSRDLTMKQVILLIINNLFDNIFIVE